MTQGNRNTGQLPWAAGALPGCAKVLTSAQMREVDRLTTERYGVTGLQLMENAASSVVRAVEVKYGALSGKRILAICGRGNNGGDGAAAACLLQAKGALINLVLLGRVAETKGDARANFERAQTVCGDHPDSFRMIEAETAEQLQHQIPADHDLYIDAIFGTGLSRPAEGIHESAIDYLNQRRKAGQPIVSIDIPSGIGSDSASLIGPSVRANLTVTFTSPKIANVLPPACHYGGELIVADIGSPTELIEENAAAMRLVEPRAVETWLRHSRRGPDANKGGVGKVLVVAGSRGKTGAACLAGDAAIRSGTGLVTVATAESSQPVVASRIFVECMTEALPETDSGAVALRASGRALALAAERDVAAIGPGLGSSDESTKAFVLEFILKRQRPCVVDADALNCLSPWPDFIRGKPDLPIILTPHPGEMARLVNLQVHEVLGNRVELARGFATRYQLFLILKGSRTLIAAPDGEVYVNPTGNAGMATGGTGDVLTGLIAGLIAQKPRDLLGSIVAAVYLHGLAGDLAANGVGTRAMIASDLTANFGQAFLEAGGDEERLSR
ncbi:MAG TPA: NAD(P)H-hydrate dehydratase [Blastocatellia bacterium]|nr:NAD(P)H-hydrate dehydratase [Blastocatellia bacterium]